MAGIELFRELSEREQRATGIRWREDPNHSGTIRVEFEDGATSILRVTRDALPAGAEDVSFIANARTDILTLLEALDTGQPVSSARHADIERRLAAASPAPWRAFIEEAGGIGGESVIWVGANNSEPDMYLFLDGRSAPAPDYEFVALARNKLDALLAAVRTR